MAHRRSLSDEAGAGRDAIRSATRSRLDIAKQIASYAPLGVQALLGSARRAFREGERVALLSLQPEFGRLSRSEDRQEYFRALQEKRSPVYVGR